MFRKCKFCNSDFKGTGYFCSDVCEIKNHASEVVTYEKDTITLEIKEEFDQVRETLTETSILDHKIVENEESSIQVGVNLRNIKSKT